MKSKLLSHIGPVLCFVLAACGGGGASDPPGGGGAAGGHDGGGAGGTGATPQIQTGGNTPVAGSAGFGGPCEPGSADCQYVASGPACGDGELNQDYEVCDDGNSVPGDGCTGGCRVERNYICEDAGEACVSTIECGDGTAEGAEICDDGNTASGDGCSADCYTIEDAFDCPFEGGACSALIDPCDSDTPPLSCQCDGGADEPAACAGGIVAPACGDGAVNQSDEECDDGNALPGDGCTGACAVEQHYTCAVAGQLCALTFACGNGGVEPGEACDDGDAQAGDGCSADCTRIEDGWYCPNAGAACVRLGECGDGRLSAGENCDDGDTTAGDGCSTGCRIEAGYRCLRPGETCEKVPVCGDGVKASSEECDDRNTIPRDGCSPSCVIEASWWDCSSVGQPCASTVTCGDGAIEGTETCDDGNTLDHDGCDAQCELTPGWECRVPGERCIPLCGDAVRFGGEECDDGDRTTGDGCSSTCRIEPGYRCTSARPNVCSRTVCGDGTLESPYEICDVGAENGVYRGDGSGCSKNCTREPTCRVGGVTQACSSSCGDGLLLGSEECDDGNLAAKDGCSATCTVEPGFTCTTYTDDGTEPCSTNGTQRCLALPIVYRDFTSYGFSGGHDDFFFEGAPRSDGTSLGTIPNQVCPGLVADTLDAYGKPGLVSGTCAGVEIIFSADSFGQWYRTTDRRHVGTLELLPIAGDLYQFSKNTASGGFFPLDPYAGSETLICSTQWPYHNGLTPVSCAPNNHDFWFTSEVRYLLPYEGGEQLTFYGDDDVWVFVNGRLAVDLGGTHQQAQDGVTLGATGDGRFAMITGNVYEIVVFHAERHPIESNYQLTLSGFQMTRSQCGPTCGDGLATVLEECDEGAANEDGRYNGCTTECRFGPFCGDRVTTTTAGEECDDGVNATIGYNVSGCGPGCKNPPRCGDGAVDAGSGEECDDGAGNADLDYGGCSASCKHNPYCGDGVPNGGEECDDGLNIGGYGYCAPGCLNGARCGDGVAQPEYGELCDEGGDNGQPGSSCSSTCGLPGRCGDGIVQRDLGESCDNINDGSYGNCTEFCQFAPYCGDGVTQAEYDEMCDMGAENAAPGSVPYGGCSTTCQIGPYCGDGLRNGPEECDVADPLTPECRDGCVLGPCGNGVVDDGEECDDGELNAPPGIQAYGKCTTACERGPFCGDELVTAGREECDNGTASNTGGYGECTAECRLGPYCGDAEVNGGEQCDDGENDGGYGECGSGCRWAEFCGDGVKQTPEEECDDGDRQSYDGCSSACRIETLIR